MFIVRWNLFNRRYSIECSRWRRKKTFENHLHVWVELNLTSHALFNYIPHKALSACAQTALFEYLIRFMNIVRFWTILSRKTKYLTTLFQFKGNILTVYLLGVSPSLVSNWDSQQGRGRKTSILLVAFWNFKLKVLKYPRNCRLHATLILKVFKKSWIG